MAKIDAKLMNITLACLCQSGEQHIYPVYGRIRKTSKMFALSVDEINGFIAATNKNRLLVAEFLEPGVLTECIGVSLKNIKSVVMDKTFWGNISVKIDICDKGEDYSIHLIFAKNVNTTDLPYQKVNLDGLLGLLKNREKFCELSENAKSQTDSEIKVTKKASEGPDPVEMMLREKQYVLELCDRLEEKYGRAEFGKPLSESEIELWEANNKTTIPDDLREWLKFAGESRFKGIPLEFYPMKKYQKMQDYVVIGQREDLPIAFETDGNRYITIEGNKRRNLGSMETILRFWGYDAKELFKDEELEKIKPVIEEETEIMNLARRKAEMSGAGVVEAMEYFFAKNNIGYLYMWQSYPKCPLRKELAECELVISEPDREGYYQWKPKKQITPVNFEKIESELGFHLHKDIKELVSHYFYFMLEGNIEDESFFIYGMLPIVDIEHYVIDAFEKESYAGGYRYITEGHFFKLGGACIDGDDSFVLEINNENGEILAVEYMDKKHFKFADSLRDLFMNSKPIWYQD
ncbi:MAG: SecY-interacting protein Syd [Lachnospiraceae bacterium]|nr:SecY-interacting protein Syd [Lachnospiraceae bacterium]